MVELRAVDIVQPDMCYLGGLTRALRVARMAAEDGHARRSPLSNPSLVTVFTTSLLAAIPNAGPHMEFSIEPTSWTEGLYTPALEVRDGKVDIPSGPGWGVEINPAWLEGSEYAVSELD